MNTHSIIKFQFWRMTYYNPQAVIEKNNFIKHYDKDKFNKLSYY